MANFHILTDEDRAKIASCLRAAAYGPFFIDPTNIKNPYWEIHSLFGITIEELRQVTNSWPDFMEPCTDVAVRNTLGNLFSYPHGISDVAWSEWLGFPAEEIKRLLKIIE